MTFVFRSSWLGILVVMDYRCFGCLFLGVLMLRLHDSGPGRVLGLVIVI